MILPQLEAGTHGVDVVGIFFSDDNVWALRSGDPIGERLAAVSKQTGTILMACDNCALERNLANGEPPWCDLAAGQGRTEAGECEPIDMVEGATVGCSPDLYFALSGNPPDQVISLWSDFCAHWVHLPIEDRQYAPAAAFLVSACVPLWAGGASR
jgi:hypothetical protein